MQPSIIGVCARQTYHSTILPPRRGHDPSWSEGTRMTTLGRRLPTNGRCIRTSFANSTVKTNQKVKLCLQNPSCISRNAMCGKALQNPGSDQRCQRGAFADSHEVANRCTEALTCRKCISFKLFLIISYRQKPSPTWKTTDISMGGDVERCLSPLLGLSLDLVKIRRGDT